MLPTKKTVIKAILYALIILGLAVAYYFMPHIVTMKESANCMGIVENDFYSCRGYIVKQVSLDKRNNSVWEGHYITTRYPLYKWWQKIYYNPDLMKWYDKPGVPHWSRLQVNLDEEGISVVLEDPNQDGIVDKCYSKPIELLM